ncbi:MAG: LLM class flavin-dependent oxidoreductase [Thermomicrobiales bacterium]|nr:LLM class flavin-dependent oxidoreductase [Thermomicrobiales bacterium]
MSFRTTPHPWVAERRGRVNFALQAVAPADADNPGRVLLRAAQSADRLGFDGFFLGDHPAWAPEPWLHLGAAALLTDRVWLGQMVLAAPYRNPLLTARLASDLDRLAGGRTVLGLGIGWNAADYGIGSNEFDRMGLPYPPTRQRQDALEETIAIMRGVWGSEPFSFAGQFHRVEAANVPPPLQPAGPPLVIAGAGERTLRQVARLGDICNFGPGPAGRVDTPDDARSKLATLIGICAEIGRPIETVLPSHFTHWLLLAPDEAAVAAKVARYFPNGLDPFWGAQLIAGTPELAAAYYQGFVDAGIDYFIVQTLDPSDEETLVLATERVLPMLHPRAVA